MKNFVEFLFKKTYVNNFNKIKNEKYIEEATEMTIEDMKYHNKESNSDLIINNIKNNGNELPVFLYRLGNIVYNKMRDENVWENIHWLIKECCSCEIYFSSNIDVGFNIVHSSGMVIGPRHDIGKGFKIYQGCTIGQRKSTGDKIIIGDDVTLYCNSIILGSLKIGDKVTIGANSLILKDIPSDERVYGIIK